MYHLLLLAGCMFTQSQALPQAPTTHSPKTMPHIFAHKPNGHLYWDALLHAANGNKQEALRLVELIRSNVAHEPAPTATASIDALFDQIFLDMVTTSPQFLTWLGLFESIGINDHNALLNDISYDACMHKIEIARIRLAQLRDYDATTLTDDQRTTQKIAAWYLEHFIAGAPFVLHNYLINQMDGTLSYLNNTCMVYHQLNTVHDAQQYVERIAAIAQQLDQAVEFMTQQQAAGFTLPRFTVERVIASIAQLLPENHTEHIFYKRVSEFLATHNTPETAELLDRARTVIKDSVYPAFNKLHNHFVTLLATTHNNHGVWALPNGDAYYRYILKSQTTTDLTPDEIHALGLQEVATIHATMRALLAKEGIVDAQKSVGQLMQQLADDKRFYFENTDEGRAACLVAYHDILERSRTQLGHLFDIKPQAGVTIKRVPLHEQDGSAGAYYCSPSIDGARAGVFFANLRNMNEVPMYGLETLTIHEAEPGHHFQLALQNEMQMPILRKIGDYNAYIEGWALYTEKLAYEHNFYSSTWSQLGHLRDEILRAARLVVDTGIHAHRWTREQAIEYMEHATGFHHDSVVSEVERYFVLPGQACSYKIGQLKILELRERAKNALKDKFSLPEFHNVVLQLGAAPLDILEHVVDAYIARKKE